MKKLNVGLIGAGWMGKTHSFCYKAQRQIFGPDPFVLGLSVRFVSSSPISDCPVGSAGYFKS